jgi:hypothetical protein
LVAWLYVGAEAPTPSRVSEGSGARQKFDGPRLKAESKEAYLVTGLKTGHYRADVMRDVVSFLGNSVRENG